MGFMVFKYGLRWPTTNEDVVREQMHLAHTYRNTLTEIECARRAAVRALLSESGLQPFSEAAEAAEAEVAVAVVAVKLARSRARERKVPPEVMAPLKEARAVAKAARQRFVEACRALRAGGSAQNALDEIQIRAKELRLAARAISGLYSGTYDLVDSAAAEARKMPLYDGAEPNDPAFVRWTGEGSIGVQIAGGMPSNRLFGAHTLLRVNPVNPAAWSPDTRRGDRLRLARTVLHFRAKSDENHKPVWAEIPMLMARPIPAGSVIKRAAVHLRKIGPREEWTLTITADVPAHPRHGEHGSGVVAVDLGWRQIGDELRVALWRGDDGATGEIRVPGSLFESLRKPDELRSVRDRAFDRLRVQLTTGLDAAPADSVPSWLLEATRTMGQWRSIARLAALVIRWQREKEEADPQGYGAWRDALRALWATQRDETAEASAVEAARRAVAQAPYAAWWPGERALAEDAAAWLYHDNHLWRWESDQRRSALRRRAQHYRLAAIALAKRYGILVLEDFDLRGMARRSVAESPTGDVDQAHSNRHLSAPSELRNMLRQTFSTRGAKEALVPPQNTTRECNACGSIQIWDAAKELRHHCSACHAEWDQDDNAALNLLDLWREQSLGDRTTDAARVDTGTTESSAPKETRWARARRLGAERTARLDTARESPADL